MLFSDRAAPVTPYRPVDLVPVDRSHRAVLSNLGQLFRHDLSEAYGELPNDDGTFNDRQLDLFLSGTFPRRQAWLITSEARTAGFAMAGPAEGGGMSIVGFFVVRALRRTGIGKVAAIDVVSRFPGRWRIGFQRHNPGATEFWSSVATEVAGHRWEITEQPPDTFITFKR